MNVRRRLVPLGLAGACLVVALVPPVATQARRYEFVEAVQFALLALAVPALVVLGAPWWCLGLAGRPTSRLADRLADARRRHPERWRAFAFLGVDLVAMVAWRTPGAVEGLERYPWLAVVEAVTLALAGSVLWLELVGSPPLQPRLPRPWRAALAMVAMWTVWVVAYALGFSHVPWFDAYHRAGGLSTSADQQLATGVLWFTSACAFLPVIFWDAMQWLRSDDDSDVELYRLLQAERRAGVRPPPGDRRHPDP